MDAMNTSGLSSGGGNQGASGNTPRSNYRRAFKPNLPSSSGNQHGPAGGDGPSGGGGFYENPIQNR